MELTDKQIARFWNKVVKTEDEDGCWLWTGFIEASGYGRTYHNYKPHLVHRVSYELSGRRLEPNMVIDHLCRIRRCVNPAHLELVTSKVNTQRGIKRSERQTCLEGHGYTPNNTILLAVGGRVCRICRED